MKNLCPILRFQELHGFQKILALGDCAVSLSGHWRMGDLCQEQPIRYFPESRPSYPKLSAQLHDQYVMDVPIWYNDRHWHIQEWLMWAEILNSFEEQSGLANFIQISGGVLAVSLSIWRGYRWFRRRQISNRVTTVSKWLQGRVFGPAAAGSLRVAVVDDHPEDYPLDTLRRLGYSIASFDHLTLADVPSLLTYDCVFLDINGVLDEDPKRGGLEILKRLKVPSGPYIVAVSSRGFDITMSEFFMLANHRLKKPIPHADIEGIIERAFASSFSAEQAAQRIDSVGAFASSPSPAKKKAFAAIRNYLESGVGLDEVRSRSGLILPIGHSIESLLSDLDVIRRSLGRAP